MATETTGETVPKARKERDVKCRYRLEIFAPAGFKFGLPQLEGYQAAAKRAGLVCTIGPRLGNAKTGRKPDPITTQVRITPPVDVRVRGTRIAPDRMVAIETDAKALAAAKAAGFATVAEFVHYLTGNGQV